MTAPITSPSEPGLPEPGLPEPALPEPGLPGPGRGAPPATRAMPRPRPSDTIVRSAGLTLTLLAVLILGFVGYLYFLSGLQEARAQTTLYATLRGELGLALAPTGPVIPGHPASPASLAAAPGDPVALLSVPAIGISNMVVVEGTSPQNLTAGPGHLRDTPLPGQGGVSVVFGRRATSGAPFERLPQLANGDTITATTSQGVADYQVIAVSDSSEPVPFKELPNQLLLVTADSRYAPAHYIEVEAKLVNVTAAGTKSTTPFPSSGYLPSVSAAETALGRDYYALISAMAWAIALAVTALAGSLLAARWARWPAWVVTVPVLIAIVWNLYQALSALLPNLQLSPGGRPPVPPDVRLIGPDRKDRDRIRPDQTDQRGSPMTETAYPKTQPLESPLYGLEARRVSAWFGKRKVLERVTLDMPPGTVTALIGPSGCGKSTFLRILNRMHEMIPGAQLSGEVLLAGQDIYHPSQRPQHVRSRIGMVFQKPNPFPTMSIYDNVLSGLKLAGIKVRDKDSLVESCLRRAGLWDEVRSRMSTPGGALSGGQQQRLCIARSLAVSPDVLLMDEPCSALDPTSTRRVEETIAEISSQVTIVIVTHNMQQAQRVSQYCSFFLAGAGEPGGIVESGMTEQLFGNPHDPRTADYVHGRFG